jgi:hypothetical protein
MGIAGRQPHARASAAQAPQTQSAPEKAETAGGGCSCCSWRASRINHQLIRKMNKKGISTIDFLKKQYILIF